MKAGTSPLFGNVKAVTRIHIFVAIVFAAALLSVVASNSFVAPAFPLGALIAYFALTFGLEYWSVALPHQAKGSVAFIVFIAVAILFGPYWATFIAGASLFAAQILGRRPFVKVIFNVSQRV